MTRRPAPLFLERRSYRRRRLADAARMLPVLGTLLLLLPLLWSPQTSPTADTARGGIYVFVVWGGLILAAFLIARRLDARGATQRDGDADGEDASG